MNAKISERFDAVMARLKPIEPSSAFDFEFRKALAVSAAKRSEETLFKTLVRRSADALERLREALIPGSPALVRLMAVFIFFISAVLYVYSAQPASPVVYGLEGRVMVQGSREPASRLIMVSRALRVGDTISVGEDAQADIVCPNRYAIRVKPGTTFRIAGLVPRIGRGTVDFRMADGNMLIDIERGFAGSRFLVTTDAGTARALGTKFSVSSSRKDRPRMDVDVFEGRVAVKSSYRPPKILMAKQTVIVGPGQGTEVVAGAIPEPPQRLVEKKWRELEELYQMGRKPQVILLIKNTPDRVEQLLLPCPIYIKDEPPRKLPYDVEEAVIKINDAIKTGDSARHLEGLGILQRMVDKDPHAAYNPQLLLYIASYYEYLSKHDQAIKIFSKVVDRYPESQYASLAQCATGIICEDKLNDRGRGEDAYRVVLERYPDSLEALWIEKKLGIKKGR